MFQIYGQLGNVGDVFLKISFGRPVDLSKKGVKFYLKFIQIGITQINF